NRARYLQNGRWMTQDPLGFETGDSNVYRYVHNEPAFLIDPKGLDQLPPPPKDPKTNTNKNVPILTLYDGKDSRDQLFHADGEAFKFYAERAPWSIEVDPDNFEETVKKLEAYCAKYSVKINQLRIFDHGVDDGDQEVGNITLWGIYEGQYTSKL